MHQETGNSGLCVMQWADENKQGRPAIVLTDSFYANYVKKIQGRDYAQVAGLIKIARDAGYAPIQTDVAGLPNKENGHTVMWSAKVYDPYSKDWWKGHADCNPENVSNPKLAKSFIRIGETRAVGRALRFALGIDLVTLEELSDVEEGDWGPDEKPNSKLPAPEKKEVKKADQPSKAPAANVPLISDAKLGEIKRLVDEEHRATWYEVRDYATEQFKKARRTDLTEDEGQLVVEWLKSRETQEASA